MSTTVTRKQPAAATLTTKVELDDDEPELLRAIQFVYGVSNDEVAAMAWTEYFERARADSAVNQIIDARRSAVDEMIADGRMVEVDA